MAEVFEMDSGAKMVAINIENGSLDTKKVLIFIDHENKTVYLWRGNKAELFKKLMGTRVAAKLSHTYPKYRIRPIAEGTEPAAFLDLAGVKR
ncbi:MAG: hypothetical protein ACTSV9_03610 [Candidatus Thorarchaeota archaeon]